MIVADTSGLLAFFNTREPKHGAARTVVEAEPAPIVVSPFVVAELDYLVTTRLGIDAELGVLNELSAGAYDLPAFTAAEIRAATSIIERCSDQDIGLADASIVVLAARYDTRSLLTLDHRHFDVVRPIGGGRFRLLP